jgi:hypothetical protein
VPWWAAAVDPRERLGPSCGETMDCPQGKTRCFQICVSMTHMSSWDHESSVRRYGEHNREHASTFHSNESRPTEGINSHSETNRCFSPMKCTSQELVSYMPAQGALPWHGLQLHLPHRCIHVSLHNTAPQKDAWGWQLCS